MQAARAQAIQFGEGDLAFAPPYDHRFEHLHLRASLRIVRPRVGRNRRKATGTGTLPRARVSETKD